MCAAPLWKQQDETLRGWSYIDSSTGFVWRGDKRAYLTPLQFDIFKMIWHAKHPVLLETVVSQIYQLRLDCDMPEYADNTIRTQIAKMRLSLRTVRINLRCGRGCKNTDGYVIEHIPLFAPEQIAA